MNVLSEIAQLIADSALNDATLYLLRNVPGLPPIVQTIHIISIAAVMASVVFIALRSMRLAVPSQDLREMTKRLQPWMWWALLVLALSGSVLILARPHRYFANPVMGWKMAFLVGAVLLSLLLMRWIARLPAPSTSGTTMRLKLVAGAVLVLWILTGLAGRWIAYSEYLFDPA